MNSIKRLSAVFMIFLLLLLGGCVKRNLNIKSDPPGATVYLNEKVIGVTPLDFDFMWYATYRIKLVKEGCAPVEELIRIRAPFFQWIPLDFIFELIPYTFWDRRELTYTLQ